MVFRMDRISDDNCERENRGSQASLFRQVNQFRREEDGTLTIFALFMFVLMLMITGMAIDLMRYEATRTTLQNTVDRAILAAADLDNELDPDGVVQDYFAKAGLSDFLVSVHVEEGLNFRSVQANTAASIPTLFMSFNPPNQPAPDHPDRRRMKYWLDNMGRNNLVAAATGTAIQQFNDIEVSMVLDVSGSMNSHSRIQNLKVAAKEFVETITTKDAGDPSLTTVSIVPYSAVVNVGPILKDHYAFSNDHGYSYCPRFPTSAFNTISISNSSPLDLIMHFEYGSNSSSPINRPWCPNESFRGNEIIAPTNDVQLLQDAIDDLEAYGNTAIDMGMKWGVALLDPSARPMYDSLIDNSDMPAIVSGRPTDYGDALKVVVVMSDGSNTTEYDIDEPYKSGMSDLWIKRDFPGQAIGLLNRNRISIRYDINETPLDHTDDEFMRLNSSSSNRWRTTPYGYDAYDDAPDSAENDGLVTRLSWQEIYAAYEYKYINNRLLYEARTTYIPNSGGKKVISYAEYMGPEWARSSIVNSTQADGRLSTICGVSRQTGILVYAIAFEAPSGGQAALLDCASSPSHYFDVEGTDISDAFAAIASEITSLRLTQ